MSRSTLQKDSAAETLGRAQASAAGVLTFDSPSQVQETITVNSKRLFGFTRKTLPPDLPSDPLYFVYSISEYSETVDLGPGLPKFTVEACEPGEQHGEGCPIPCQVFLEEAQVDKTEHTVFTASQIVGAVMKQGAGMPSSLDRRKIGWFVSKTNPPKAEEIKAAVDIYTEECKRLVAEGNRFAAASQLTEINEMHRRSARYIKQKVDWDKTTHKMVDCPRCKEPVRSDAMIHAVPYCGHVLQPIPYWRSMIEAGQKTLADVPEPLQEELAKDLKRKPAGSY